MDLTSILLTLILAGTSGALCWLLARTYEQRMQEMKVGTLEAKFQSAQSRANQLNEQLMRVQHELYAAASSLEKERKERVSLIADYARPFRKTNVMMIGLSLFLGLTCGSFFAGYRAETAYLKALAELKIMAKVSEAKSSMIETKLHEIETELKQTRLSFQEEMESRIVAETKLEMITGESPKIKRNSFPFFPVSRKENSRMLTDPKLPVTPSAS